MDIKHTESYELAPFMENAIKYDQISPDSAMVSNRTSKDIDRKHIAMWLYKSKSQQNSPFGDMDEPPLDEQASDSPLKRRHTHCPKDTIFMPKMHMQRTEISPHSMLESFSSKSKSVKKSRRSLSGGRHTHNRSFASHINASMYSFTKSNNNSTLKFSNPKLLSL